MPNLLRQETNSISCALRMLFQMLNDADRLDMTSEVEERLLE